MYSSLFSLFLLFVSMTVSWQPLQPRGSIEIQRRTLPDGVYTTIGSIDAAAEAFHDVTPLTGYTYCYRARFFTADRFNTFSEEVCPHESYVHLSVPSTN